MAIYRVEVIGPFPVGKGREYWAIPVFDDKGVKIGQLDAYSEKEAIEIKDEIMRRLATIARFTISVSLYCWRISLASFRPVEDST